MNLTDRTLAPQVIAAFTASGAKPPKVVADTFTATLRLAKAGRDLGVREDVLVAAVAAALDDGRDPAADPDVQRVLAARAIGNEHTSLGVAALAYDRFRDVCRDHADQIVAAWSKPFDVAAAAIAEAHQRIGDVPLDDTAAVVRKGGDIASDWAKAQQAVTVIATIDAGWGALAEFARLVAIDRRYRLLRIADVDWPTWVEQELERKRVNAWDATRLGLTLSLPTFGEYRARVTDFVDADARHRQQVEQAAKDRASGRTPDLAAGVEKYRRVLAP